MSNMYEGNLPTPKEREQQALLKQKDVEIKQLEENLSEQGNLLYKTKVCTSVQSHISETTCVQLKECV